MENEAYGMKFEKLDETLGKTDKVIKNEMIRSKIYVASFQSKTGR